MHSKPRGHHAATFPVTIQTPYGVLRMAYELGTVPCAECGNYHSSVVILDASPRLKSPEASEFLLDVLPVLLGSLGDLAYLHCATSSTKASSAVVG